MQTTPHICLKATRSLLLSPYERAASPEIGLQGTEGEEMKEEGGVLRLEEEVEQEGGRIIDLRTTVKMEMRMLLTQAECSTFHV